MVFKFCAFTHPIPQICVTGLLNSLGREGIQKYLANHGAKVAKSITKKLTHLVRVGWFVSNVWVPGGGWVG